MTITLTKGAAKQIRSRIAKRGKGLALRIGVKAGGCTGLAYAYPKIDFQAISSYSAPKPRPKLASMNEVAPELLRTFEKLGVPMHMPLGDA